jgi:hypothetical protein
MKNSQYLAWHMAEQQGQAVDRGEKKGQKITRDDLANALAKNAGLTPPREPTLGAMQRVTALRSLSKAAPQPGIHQPSTRTPSRDHGPER